MYGASAVWLLCVLTFSGQLHCTITTHIVLPRLFQSVSPLDYDPDYALISEI